MGRTSRIITGTSAGALGRWGAEQQQKGVPRRGPSSLHRLSAAAPQRLLLLPLRGVLLEIVLQQPHMVVLVVVPGGVELLEGASLLGGEVLHHSQALVLVVGDLLREDAEEH